MARGKTRLRLLAALALAASVPALEAGPLETLAPSLEILDSSDVAVRQANVLAAGVVGSWETRLSVAAGDYEIDFEPASFDRLLESASLSESNLALQANVRRPVGEGFWLLGGVGAYDGFSNFRSVWLAEYYRQRFGNIEGVVGAENYVEPDPWGVNVSAGARWEYLPASGFAQVVVSQLRDEVAPGYEIDFDGLRRSELSLATTAIGISTENVLSRRVRSQLDLRASTTSAREWRYGAEYAVNAAVGEKWIFKGKLGAATEQPQFDALYGEIGVERELREGLALYFDARVYEDTGEIENALLFTSAAPGLVSQKIGLGLRWIGERWSGRIYVAALESDYDPTDPNTDFFQNLYRDRDWTIGQFALERKF